MARLKYGMTVWGAWFLEMLARYDGSGRITRGKSYANTGKVDSLVIKHNTIAARVKGYYEPWYYITLTIPPLSDINRKKLQTILQKNPLERAALKNGTMSPILLEEIKKKKIRFMPAQWSRIKSSCTCPDLANPCKHIAAVLYTVSKEIDYDPRLLFQLAGFDKNFIEDIDSAALTDKAAIEKNAEQGKDKRTANTVSRGEYDSKQEMLLSRAIELPVPLSLRCADDSSLPLPKQSMPSFSGGESYLPLITSFLSAEPVFYSGDIITALTGFYHAAIHKLNRDFGAINLDVASDNITEEKMPEQQKTAYQLRYARISIEAKRMLTGKTDFPLAKREAMEARVAIAGRKSLHMPLKHLWLLFFSIQPAKDSPAGVKALAALFTLAKKLIYESGFIPAVYVHPRQKSLRIFWKPLTLSQEIVEAVTQCAASISEDFFAPVTQWGKRYSTELLLTAFLTEYAASVNYHPPETAAQNHDIVEAFFKGGVINTNKPGMRNIGIVISTWLTVLNYSNGEYRYRLIVKEAQKTHNFTLSAMVLLNKENPNEAIDLYKLVKNAEKADSVLQFPAALSTYLPKLSLLATKKTAHLSQEETADFLKHAAPLLKRFGIEVVLPKTLQKVLTLRSVICVEKRTNTKAVTSFLNLESIVHYDRSIMLGDAVITEKELQALIDKSSSLVTFKNHYVLIDPAQAAEMLRHISAEKPTVHEVIQGVLTGNTVTQSGKPVLQELFTEVDTAVPPTLQAQLRPYQQKGFQWLYATVKNGFGCLLGDDMGLGKTLQVIALILKLKEQHFTHAGVLIAAPASLLANWEHELVTFAPTLSYKLLHGSRRTVSSEVDVHITTYQTLQRDAEKLRDLSFDCLILDEAQAIKNAGTKNAQAVRLIQADARIAMTGTPIENSLEDMRSLFDFLIPGYLGTAEEFRKKWRIPIELHGDTATSDMLQKITAPFLLRRLKTDPAVIADLPEKIVSAHYCRLTPVQTALYETVINEQLNTVLNTDNSIQRSALILKLLTALKQICNHPHVYDGSYPLQAELSGKIMSLYMLLEEIRAAGEKVLIFSQYTQTLFLLQNIIEAQFEEPCLLLHGRMNIAARKKAVEQFQTDSAQRIFLISLKAGGTGLNLTAASRVIHFDLWYNPAVEDQATDRAFRIGQHNNVFVHRFICSGTFEEKIDAMIQKKREIAQLSLSTGETWIGKMSNEELIALLSG